MSLLSSMFEFLGVIEVGERLFLTSGVEERVAIALADGFQSRASPVIRYGRVDALDELVDFARASGNERDLPPTDGTLACADAILKRLERDQHVSRLRDLASVRIGEVVGDTRFFVKNADEWSALGIGRASLRPLVTRMRQLPGLFVTEGSVAATTNAVPLVLKPPRQHRMSKSVVQYLSEYPKDAREGNATFAKRDPWYAIPYDGGAALFIGSMCHDGPRAVINDANVSCGNGLYKMHPADGVKPLAVALGVLSTVAQLSAELHGRPRSAGALKLEPSDVVKLRIPATLGRLGHEDQKELGREADALLRKGRVAEASELVDRKLLHEPGLVSVEELGKLRDSLASLRRLRWR